jgi:putative sigma-54 modulation protein
MELYLKGQHIGLSDAIRAYIGRRLAAALRDFERHVRSIEVRLGDVNGPRGGTDKSCAITVGLRRLGVVFASATGADAYRTVDGAVSRIHGILRRRFSRRRSERRPVARVSAGSRTWRRKRASQ